MDSILNKTPFQLAAKAWDKLTLGNLCNERAIPIIQAAIEEATEQLRYLLNIERKDRDDIVTRLNALQEFRTNEPKPDAGHASETAEHSGRTREIGCPECEAAHASKLLRDIQDYLSQRPTPATHKNVCGVCGSICKNPICAGGRP